MFKRIVNLVEVLAVIAAAVFLILLFTNEPDSGGSASGGDNASPGAALFASNCARCHGSDGGGGLGPQLSDGKAAKDFPKVADQITFVTEGQGGMPGFGDDLSPQQIQEVVEYTRTL
jgi:mono/diheme cytochrome c family protein